MITPPSPFHCHHFSTNHYKLHRGTIVPCTKSFPLTILQAELSKANTLQSLSTTHRIPFKIFHLNFWLFFFYDVTVVIVKESNLLKKFMVT